MIVYFSGTGNSRYCAKLLAEWLDDTVLDAIPFIREGRAAELASDAPWIFVAPVYSWQLPHVFADFIRSGSFSGSREAYFVITCGNDIGAAADGVHALCAEKGFRDQGTLPVVMPENYIAMFAAPREDEARKWKLPLPASGKASPSRRCGAARWTA